MKSESIQLGIIGCGLIAKAHGIAARNSDRDIRFTACSSRSLESAETFADEFACRHVDADREKLLERRDLDGIVIATPPDSHAAIIADAVKAGCRFVLCEKPLTVDAKEATQIRDLARASGTTIIEGFMYRYHPQTRKLVELVRSNELGPVDHIHCSINMLDASEIDDSGFVPSWRREQEVGGVVHDFLCYPIDLANLLMQQQPKSVFARVFKSPRYNTLYRVFGMLEYENGVVASIGASRMSDFSQPLFIGCEKGSVRLETAFNPTGSTKIVVSRSDGLIGRRRSTVAIPLPEPASKSLIDLPVFQWQLEHFADLITGDARPAVDIEDSLRNARTRDALIAAGSGDCWRPIV